MLPNANQRLCFSYDEDEKLVQTISSHPAIYDPRHPLYQRVKDNIWIEISDETGRSVADCKKRWRNIKDTYDRRIRENNKTRSEPVQQPCKKVKKWQLQDKLSFLQNVDVHRKCLCNINEDYEESGNGEQDDSFSYSLPKVKEEPIEPIEIVVLPQPTSPEEVLSQDQTDQPMKMDISDVCFAIEKCSKERDVMVKNLLEKDDETDVTLFFKSIAKSVQKFPPYLQQRAKLETLALISNIESDMWASRQGTSRETQMLTTSSPLGCSVSTSDSADI